MTTTTSNTSDIHADPRHLLDRAIATAASVISGVRADQLDDATPCSEMDVRTMLRHLVGVLDRITALGQGEDPFAVVETDAPDDGWPSAWASASERLADAWRDDAVLVRPMALPWIQGSGADILVSYFSEVTVHTWDLATATDQQPEWDDTVIEVALANRDFLPAEHRLELYAEISAAMGLDEVAVPFAERVVVPDDASPIDQLVAWNGRDPRG
ncbi:MAG: TIGR03086 family metal-binding protein [Acidimicrobiales bacterium]